MPKFISYPGASHSNTEKPYDGPLGLNPRASEFYAARERRRRNGNEPVVSGFTKGDRETFRGEEVTVEHREHDQHTNTERLWMRGDKTGTFISEWKPTGPGSAEIVNVKRTHE